MISSRAFRGVFVLVAVLLSLISVRADDHLLIDAKINGRPVQLAFDTGSGIEFALWQNAADQLGLKIVPASTKIASKPGQVNGGVIESVRLEFFGNTFDDVAFRVIESPPFTSPVDFQGVVGWPALNDNVIELKLAEDTMAMGGKVPPESKDWLKLRVRADRDTLCVDLPKGQSGDGGILFIDTGSVNAVSLSSEKWRAWKASNPRQPITLSAYYTPGAGLVVAEQSWADELSLGGLVIHDVAVSQSDTPSDTAGSLGYVAALGLAALRRLDLVIDGKAGLIYVHPRIDAPAAYQHNRLGAVFVPQSDQSDDLVAHVAAASPAAIAGIRDGDRLLSIDQLDVTKWRTQPGILPLGRFWEQADGTKVVLTVKRGNVTTKTTVTLKNILAPKSQR